MTMLKFDIFFFLGFTIQFVVIVQDSKTAEFAVTVAAIPITILIIGAAVWATIKEIKPLMLASIVRTDIFRWRHPPPYPQNFFLTNMHMANPVKLGLVHWWLSILHLQNGPYVLRTKEGPIRISKEITYFLRCHHNSSNHFDNCQRLCVLQELRQ